MLKQIMPLLIEHLKTIARTKKQVSLAEKVGVHANQISRYKTGREFPDDNLFKMCEALGLSAGQSWWLLSYTMETALRHYRFQIAGQGQPGEVREPATPYGDDLFRELEEVMALDLTELPPEEMLDLNRQRNAIRGDWSDARADYERRKKSLRERMALFRDGVALVVRRVRAGR